MQLSTQNIINFQNQILEWYAEHKRDLPRRDSTNGYHILLSEIMSQQTQVSRVIPKYYAFLEKLPTIQDLAHTDKKTLLTLRSGLGYNNRALRLQRTAQIINQNHNGQIPTEEKILLSLPGIGKYTAHALLAFLYNQEVPVLDINIRRVLCHHFALDPAIAEKELRNIAYTLIPKGKSKDRHNALMDYGALVYTSKRTGIASAKQSKFIGSRRRVRGSIMKKILHHGPQKIKELQKDFAHKDFDNIIKDMIQQGLLTQKGKVLHIHEQ